jgi:hypothetical protein
MTIRERIAGIFTPTNGNGHAPPAGLGLDTTITDEGSWSLIAGGGPADRPWYDLAQDMTDALEAWRKNFLIRQVVRLTTAYVIGDGIKITSEQQPFQTFVTDFWHHRQNQLDRRLVAWCDELTRTGELFLVLFPNPIDGMSYVRAVPARCIEHVETDPEDYEKEINYKERVLGKVEIKNWSSPITAAAADPVMLHYTINQPLGATRGESDLTPILPWVKRYTTWLKDRVKFNQIRTDMSAAWVKIQDDGQVTAKRRQYEANPPTGGNIFVTGPGEELSFPSASIEAGQAEPDGVALRLAVAAGANIPLHYLAEGTSATKATATEMADPTRRHYRMRQVDFGHILTDLCEQAYIKRSKVLDKQPYIRNPQAQAEMPDVSREDNGSLAEAAKAITEAFNTMQEHGWIDKETAVRLIFKFAGEVLPEAQIQHIIDPQGDNQ